MTPDHAGASSAWYAAERAKRGYPAILPVYRPRVEEVRPPTAADEF